MTIGLTHYLTVAAVLFTIGVFGIFVNRKNVIVILMSIELILLAVNINLVAFSVYLHDVTHVDVSCDEPVGLQLDGEYLGHVSEAAIRYHPAAVRVLIPPAAVAFFPAPERAAAGM